MSYDLKHANQQFTLPSLTSAIFCFMVYVSGESEAPFQTAPNLELYCLTTLIPLFVISALVLQPSRYTVGSKSIRAGAYHKN